jgi:hypothetical protein
MGVLAESGFRQAEADQQCRMALGQGHGIRLSALFAFSNVPVRDAKSISAQAHSVVRFLLSQKPREFSGDAKSHNDVKDPANPTFTFHYINPEAAFLAFLQEGWKTDWGMAAKEVYGFDDVAAMEKTWLEWMTAKESRFTRPALDPLEPVATQYPPLIPPVKLP